MGDFTVHYNAKQIGFCIINMMVIVGVLVPYLGARKKHISDQETCFFSDLSTTSLLYSL